MSTTKLKIYRTNPDEVRTPHYSTDGSGAMDIYAYLPEGDRTLYPGEIARIPTGIHPAVEPGYGLFISPKSGLALAGKTIANSPGLVDSDYRDEIGVLVQNHNDFAVDIKHDTKIAQFWVIPLPKVEIEDVPFLNYLGDPGTRNGGFGSTGLEAPR